MKYLPAILTLFLSLLPASAPANTCHPPDHVKHNMLLHGETPTFASHIVYKQPHHYQVILELTFDPATHRIYVEARARHPGDQLILLLEPLLIQEIAAAPALSGALIRKDHDGERHVLVERVTIPRNRFHVRYLQELPLSLSAE